MSNSQTTQVSNSPNANPFSSPLIRGLLELDDDLLESVKPIKKPIKIKYNKTIYFNQRVSRNNPRNEKEDREEMLSSCKAINVNVNINNNYFTSYALPDSKGRPKQFVPVDDEIDPLFIGVPCMNCGNSIAIDLIEKHSGVCTRVSEEMMRNDQSTVGLYSINYKLKKLKEHLTMISNGKIYVPIAIDKEMKGATQTLINFVHSVSNMETIALSTIKEFKMIMKGLEELSEKYNGVISAMILIDRTKILVNEKTKIFKEEYRLLQSTKATNSQKTGSLKGEEKLKESLILHSKCKGDEEELSSELQSHKLKCSQNILDEIVSDIEKRSCLISSNTSLSSIVMGKEEEEFLNDNEINIDFSSINSEAVKEKKAFFKTVLRLKFEKLHSTHLGQKISQSALYKEVKRNNIPRDKWNDFIIKELKSPNKYMASKGMRLTDKMDVIEEEKQG